MHRYSRSLSVLDICFLGGINEKRETAGSLATLGMTTRKTKAKTAHLPLLALLTQHPGIQRAHCRSNTACEKLIVGCAIWLRRFAIFIQVSTEGLSWLSDETEELLFEAGQSLCLIARSAAQECQWY
jgi:hypothetical protein